MKPVHFCSAYSDGAGACRERDRKGGVTVGHEEKLSCNLKNCSQMGKLYKSPSTDLKIVQEAQELLGYDCFTGESYEKIRILTILKDLYVFSDTVEAFNKKLEKALGKVQDDKTAERIRFYIGLNTK